ncbi:MAG: hypothetical protein QME12_04310 [Nanoarchaeota archaeon]|nr:hypothetical protein [Nanoarchaeota archaeon]
MDRLENRTRFLNDFALPTDLRVIKTENLNPIKAEVTEAYLGNQKYQRWLSEKCGSEELCAGKFEFETRQRPYGLNIRVRLTPDPKTQKYITPYESKVMTFTDEAEIKELLSAFGAKTARGLVGKVVNAHTNANRVVGFSTL